MKNQTTNNAHDAYKARTHDIARLLGVLRMELNQHAKGAKRDPRCWGKVGDLGKVRNDLIDLVAFISNKQRDEVENFLAD